MRKYHNLQVFTPKVFETNLVEYQDTHDGRGAALADALTGWGLCHSGNMPPRTRGDAK